MNICKCGCGQECNSIWVKGHNGKILSEETKQKIRENKIGIPRSEETKQKIREGNKSKIRSEETKQRMRGKVRSDEFKQRLSEVNKGQIRSEETKQKIREGNIGNKHLLGKTLSEETKQRMRGRVFSEETKQKMSEANKGRVLSEETRQKMSESKKGRKPTNPYGRSKWIPYMECDLSISKMPTYEYHVRVYLDSIGESYLWCAKGNYKEHIIHLSNGQAYYPDFFLPRLKVYIDPKGFWQDLKKKALVEAEYPLLCYHFLGEKYLKLIKEFIEEHKNWVTDDFPDTLEKVEKENG